MEHVPLAALIGRWLHLGSVIVLLGGLAFWRMAVLPATRESVAEDGQEPLLGRIQDRWRPVVMITAGLILMSGFYNYLAVMAPIHKGDGLYHGMVGTKILMALLVLFLASALAGRSASFERFRQGRAGWLTVTILLAAVIVVVSGFLKVRGVAGPLPPG